jgi:uncharacterized repeat protein (TIGR04076 family)
MAQVDERTSGDKSCTVMAREIRRQGTCAFGHTAGDEMIFDGESIQDRIRLHFLCRFLPMLFAMRYVADFP